MRGSSLASVLVVCGALATAMPRAAAQPHDAPTTPPSSAQVAVPDPIAAALRFRGAPTRDALLVAMRALSGRAIDDLAQCRVEGLRRFVCTDTECPGSCQVVRVTYRFAIDARARVRLTSRRALDVGDTGQCGCCTFVE